MRTLVEESVIGAVGRLVRESAPAAGLLGGVWDCELPDAQSTYPAALLEYLRTDFAYTFEGVSQEQPTLQLTVFADAGAVAETLARKLANLVLERPLRLGHATWLQTKAVDLRLLAAGVRGPEARRFFKAELVLNTWVTGDLLTE